jgi:hypothetical protein
MEDFSCNSDKDKRCMTVNECLDGFFRHAGSMYFARTRTQVVISGPLLSFTSPEKEFYIYIYLKSLL